MVLIEEVPEGMVAREKILKVIGAGSVMRKDHGRSTDDGLVDEVQQIAANVSDASISVPKEKRKVRSPLLRLGAFGSYRVYVERVADLDV